MTRKKPQSWWYYLERYVHVSIKSPNLLLYNTLTGKHLEYKEQPDILRFVKRLQSTGQMQVVKLTRRYLDTHPAIAGFVKTTRKYYMADLIDTSYSKGKPIQMMPILNIHRDIKKLKADHQRSVGEELMKTLDVISIYIHSRVTPQLEKIYPHLFKEAYKQFLFNYSHTNEPVELDIRHILQLVEETSGSNLTYINIAGGDIFRYTRFNELLEILSPLPVIKNFYIPISDIESNISSIQYLYSVKQASQLVLLIAFPVEIDEIKSYIDKVRGIGIPYRCEIVVQNERHLEFAEQLQEFFPSDASIKPFFNGRNLGFFKKHAFLNKRDILASMPGIQEIFMRTAVNPANFGKLTILTDGSVYANVNTPSIGKLGNESVYGMILWEMNNGRNWRRMRSSVKPCKDCLYCNLCPPLLNYEYALRRNNLCHIFKKL